MRTASATSAATIASLVALACPAAPGPTLRPLRKEEPTLHHDDLHISENVL